MVSVVLKSGDLLIVIVTVIVTCRIAGFEVRRREVC